MSRLIRIIAHETEKGVLLDVMTADGKRSMDFLSEFKTGKGAALAIAEAATAFFLKDPAIGVAAQVETARQVELQAETLERMGAGPVASA